MLRVLAEIADEFRTGAPVFLVAAFAFLHTVIGGVPSRAAADSARAAAGPGHGVFGPYVTPADQIPDSVPKVISVRLEIQTPQGKQVVDVDPDTVNALFFTQAAVDKFAIPYYSRVYGPEYASKLRRETKYKKPPGQLPFPHLPGRRRWGGIPGDPPDSPPP
jgi:hypothetical protein